MQQQSASDAKRPRQRAEALERQRTDAKGEREGAGEERGDVSSVRLDTLRVQKNSETELTASLSGPASTSA